MYLHGTQAGSRFGWGVGEVLQQGSELSQRDVMSPKIDVFAQRALFRLLKREPAANLAAREMIFAVKTGRLAGIYKEDERAPALRAQALGMGWWQLVSRLAPGKDAVCVKEPAGTLPMMVFRDKVRSLPDRLDPALLGAWSSCGITGPEPPPYVPKSFPQAPPPIAKTPVSIAPGSIPWVLTYPSGDRPIPEEALPQCSPAELQRYRLRCLLERAGNCVIPCGFRTGIGQLVRSHKVGFKCLPAAVAGDAPALLACLAKNAPDLYGKYIAELYRCAQFCGPTARACMDEAKKFCGRS